MEHRKNIINTLLQKYKQHKIDKEELEELINSVKLNDDKEYKIKGVIVSEIDSDWTNSDINKAISIVNNKWNEIIKTVINEIKDTIKTVPNKFNDIQIGNNDNSIKSKIHLDKIQFDTDNEGIKIIYISFISDYTYFKNANFDLEIILKTGKIGHCQIEW